jgi:hypothetical protein
MARLTLLFAALAALLFYAAGCTRRVLDDNSDGGSNDLATSTGCAKLGEADCLANKSCVAEYCYACSCTPGFADCRGANEAPHMCPQYGCPQPVCNCDSLSEGACISAEKTLGCTPFYCPDCNGGQSFIQCLSPNAGPGFCAQACPQKGCHGNNDCTGGQFCLAPGQQLCGGACRADGCADDSTCSAGLVCDFDPCTCTNSGKACVPGCSTAGCPEGQTCGNSNHCLATFCQKPNDCPAQFQCDTNSHTCTRKPCLGDSDCPGGFCVENACYSMLGMCSFPAP